MNAMQEFWKLQSLAELRKHTGINHNMTFLFLTEDISVVIQLAGPLFST